MVLRRLIYCMALAGALLFQITNENYLAHFLLALMIVLPLLSLALSLPGMAGCRLFLSADPPQLARGEAGTWRLSVENRSPLPLARMSLRLETRNLLTGSCHRQKLAFTGLARRAPEELNVDTAHCGLLEFRAYKVRVWDYLGLFSLPCAQPQSTRLSVDPVPVDPGPVNIPEGQGVRPQSSGAARRGPGEDYDLREYRPGDPMRSVHWKLSSKWDELIVREQAETVTPLPVLAFDWFGSPDRLDRVLDRLSGLSRVLLAVQRPHMLVWLDRDGTPARRVVNDEKDLRDSLLSLLSAPAPASAPSIMDKPELLSTGAGPAFCIHVTAGEEDDHGKA